MQRSAAPHNATLATALLALLVALAGCGGTDTRWGEGAYKLGRPYQINGRWYRPAFDPRYDKVGTASWYGDAFQGLETANGEVFDRHELSAAHPTMPLPSIARVTNLANGRSLDVRVNDRGPFVDGRLIDLSQAAARKLGFERAGLTPVRVRFLRLADARGTPPTPGVALAGIAADRPPAAPLRPPQTAPVPPPDPRRQLALAVLPAPARPARPATAPPGPCEAAGPHYVEVGAFPDTPRVRAAATALRRVGRVVVEPLFAGEEAVARVRLGPVAGLGPALALLDRAQALGYPDAFVVQAPGPGC